MRLIILAVIAAIACTPVSSLAYKPETHEVIARAALEKSSLTKDVSDTLELDGSLSLPFRGHTAAIGNIVAYGANHEDDGMQGRNHFFDPDSEKGLLIGEDSPDWALRDNTPFSLQDAYNYLYSGLSGNTKQEREDALAKMFEALGHTLHHVADMAQPQHVRIENHCDEWRYCWFLYNPSSFEKMGLRIAPLYIDKAYQDVDFDSAREFWTSRDASGDGSGMAEFTAKNFVGAGTNFLYDRGAYTTDALHPSPVPKQPFHWVDIQTIGGPDTPNPDLRGQIGFVATDYQDDYSGDSGENPLASSFSIFTPDLMYYIDNHETFGPSSPLYGAFTLNWVNHASNMSFLVPRAIAYSTGLINHFFRGRLTVTKQSSPPGQIAIEATNTGYGTLHNGSFRVFFDKDGKRQEIAVADGANVGNMGIAHNQSRWIYVNHDGVPEPGTKAIVVFQGAIGGDTGAVAFGKGDVDGIARLGPVDVTGESGGITMQLLQTQGTGIETPQNYNVVVNGHSLPVLQQCMTSGCEYIFREISGDPPYWTTFDSPILVNFFLFSMGITPQCPTTVRAQFAKPGAAPEMDFELCWAGGTGKSAQFKVALYRGVQPPEKVFSGLYFVQDPKAPSW